MLVVSFSIGLKVWEFWIFVEVLVVWEFKGCKFWRLSVEFGDLMLKGRSVYFSFEVYR